MSKYLIVCNVLVSTYLEVEAENLESAIVLGNQGEGEKVARSEIPLGWHLTRNIPAKATKIPKAKTNG